MATVTETRADWPARAYVYGTFEYALDQARERAAAHRLRMFLYRSVLDGEPVWVASWDPKPTQSGAPQ